MRPKDLDILIDIETSNGMMNVATTTARSDAHSHVGALIVFVEARQGNFWIPSADVGF